MGDERARRGAGRLELERPGLEVVEQGGAAAEQYRRDVKTQLVQLSGVQRLLDDARTAADRNILAAGRGPSLLEGRLEAVGDKSERGAALLRDRVAHVMRDDEEGEVEGRITPPPSVGVGVVPPGAPPAAEHLAAHDDGARPRDRGRKD